MLFKASAPGSLMLLGEYAVLHGYPALVCAIDKRMRVTLEPRADQHIYLKSSLGTWHTHLAKLEIVKPFEFVLTALKKYQPYFQQGCTITIESEFSSTVGLASSAAITVAVLSAIFMWLEWRCSLNDLLKYAREIVFEVQGMGSGADVAACVYGGLIAYQPDSLSIEKYSNGPPITVVYSGSKMRTPQVVNQVKNTFAHQPDVFLNIIQAIGECTKQGIQAVADKNWVELGHMMDGQQTQMEALGVSTRVLDSIIAELRRHSNDGKGKGEGANEAGILGAKISGSGLGDCIIGLGRSDHLVSFSEKGAVLLPVNITHRGIDCEKSSC
jgi:mevalonate kinase